MGNDCFVDHYSDYCYEYLIQGTSVEEALQDKEYYELLEATHGPGSVLTGHIMEYFQSQLFNKAVHTRGQQIIYLNLGSQTLLPHDTKLLPEAVIPMLWPFLFKVLCQRYNILEIYEYRKTLDKKFASVEFRIYSMD